MIVSLSMYFDDEEYANNYPDFSQNELIRLLKQDFLDTLYKQWNETEVYEALEVVND